MWIGLYWDGTTEKFRGTDTDAELMETIQWDLSHGEPNCMTTPYLEFSTGPINQNCVRLTAVYLFRIIKCDLNFMPLCQSMHHVRCKGANFKVDLRSLNVNVVS